MQSAKTNMNVEEVFFSIARDIKQRLSDTDSKAEVICQLFSLCPLFFLFARYMQVLSSSERLTFLPVCVPTKYLKKNNC